MLKFMIVMVTFLPILAQAQVETCDINATQATSVTLKGVKNSLLVSSKICPRDDMTLAEIEVTADGVTTTVSIPGNYQKGIVFPVELDIPVQGDPCLVISASGVIRGFSESKGWSVDNPVQELHFRPCTPLLGSSN